MKSIVSKGKNLGNRSNANLITVDKQTSSLLKDRLGDMVATDNDAVMSIPVDEVHMDLEDKNILLAAWIRYQKANVKYGDNPKLLFISN